jgi:hypothetical protein
VGAGLENELRAVGIGVARQAHWVQGLWIRLAAGKNGGALPKSNSPNTPWLRECRRGCNSSRVGSATHAV